MNTDDSMFFENRSGTIGEEPGQFHITAPPDACAPEAKQLFENWRTIHPASGLPGRRHFDPQLVPRLLQHLWMLDVFRDPLRFRVRLVGTSIVDFLGRDSTGKWLHDLYSDHENTEPFWLLRDCALNGRPTYLKSNLQVFPGREHVVVERLSLPFASDGETTDLLMNLALFHR